MDCETCIIFGITGDFLGFIACIWISKTGIDCFCLDDQEQRQQQQQQQQQPMDDPVIIQIELQKPHIIFIKNPIQPAIGNEEDPM